MLVCTERENRGAMRDKTGTTRRQGQRENFTGANSGSASQLARLTGIEGLAHLTDDEAARLVELMDYLDVEAFRAGCAAMSLYNHDERLLDRGWPTNH